MSAFHPTGLSSRARPIVLLSILAAPLTIAGCASNTRSTNTANLLRQDQRPAPLPVQKVELEDDGVPVQTAPSFRVRNAPDDPTQPWSPNYGRDIPAQAPIPTELTLPGQRQALRVADTSVD
jgi:hypothetical protein